MKRILIIAAMAGAMAGSTIAQHAQVSPPTDYFNRGSAIFIRESPEQALAIVNEGLVHYPEDSALIRLKELIERQQDQQQQQQQQQQSSSSESSPDEQPPPEGEQPPEEQPSPPDEQEQDQQDQNEADKDQQPDESREQPGEPKTAEEMTEEEAEMVLDSLRQLEEAQREQVNQEMIRRSMRNMPPVEKDW